MHTLARGQTSSASNPLLDTYLIADGVLTDVYSLEYVVSEFVTSASVATQVAPVSGRGTINVVTDRVSVGRYAVPWVVSGAAPIGKYRVTFYFKVESTDTEMSYNQNLEVVSALSPDSWGTAYASVASLREEGVPAAYSDALLHRKLAEASREVESYTGRVFGPHFRDIRVDGTGAPALLLEEPIIGVASIEILTSDPLSSGPLDLSAVRVYNRHISMGLLDPDDRENAKIEWHGGSYYDYYGHRERGPLLGYRSWPHGHQSIAIKGVFGYTDPDGTSTGGVPRAIAQVTRMLALKNLPVLTDVDGRRDMNTWSNVHVRTREQSISSFSGVDAASRAAIIGALTGDPAVDGVLARYRRGPRLGSA